VEDTGAGTSLVQEMRALVSGIIAVTPKTDKVSRMIANIASDDALILPHHANPAGLNFRERQDCTTNISEYKFPTGTSIVRSNRQQRRSEK
jgi:hypothetical protein